MLVVLALALAAIAILAGVWAIATGRGDELGEFIPDIPPLGLPEAGQLGAVDLMALHLPVSLVGYHTESVDETLNRVAAALSERDTRIAVLEQRVSELLAGRLKARQEAYARPLGGPRTEHEPEAPWGATELLEAGPETLAASNGSPDASAVPYGDRIAASGAGPVLSDQDESDLPPQDGSAFPDRDEPGLPARGGPEEAAAAGEDGGGDDGDGGEDGDDGGAAPEPGDGPARGGRETDGREAGDRETGDRKMREAR
ncbi:hypothetical protein ACFYSC_04475 [Streptosporangium sp. NPDC004379]|uniref:hypothetical protein n=1 Tax=Streptosporangium sp. NPDC004379 TaxID=3366189 RepID=UPI0036CE9D0D